MIRTNSVVVAEFVTAVMMLSFALGYIVELLGL
jgi:hypothetical protein